MWWAHSVSGRLHCSICCSACEGDPLRSCLLQVLIHFVVLSTVHLDSLKLSLRLIMVFFSLLCLFGEGQQTHFFQWPQGWHECVYMWMCWLGSLFSGNPSPLDSHWQQMSPKRPICGAMQTLAAAHINRGAYGCFGTSAVGGCSCSPWRLWTFSRSLLMVHLCLYSSSLFIDLLYL